MSSERADALDSAPAPPNTIPVEAIAPEIAPVATHPEAVSAETLPAYPNLQADVPQPARASARNIHGEVWQLAWPSVLTMLLQTVNSLMDTLFVGHLSNGKQALAAT